MNPHDLSKLSGLVAKDVRLLAEDSPFADAYKPDASKAFIEFEICHSAPNFLGPVAMGTGKDKAGNPVQVSNFCAFFPDTLEVSHESLQWQQLNLRHMLAAYSDDPHGKAGKTTGKEIRHDRIIGAIVATDFPRKPMQGWRTPGNPQGGTAAIKACAVVFKLAKGVGRLMGDHLTGNETQSVSIETIASYDNMGIYVPSEDRVVPLVEPGEDIFSAFKLVKGVTMPMVGKMKTEAHPEGEQLLVTYGMGGKPIHFNGVGVTPQPAEKTAKITRMHAESQMIGIAAECIFGALVGQKVTFPLTKRVGTIEKVHTEGRVQARGYARKATTEDPVLDIYIGRERVVRHYSELADQLS